MKTVIVFGLENILGGLQNYLMIMHKYLKNDLKFVFIVEEVENFIFYDEIISNNGVIEFIPERHDIKGFIKKYKTVLRSYKSETNTVYVNISHISFDILPIEIAINEGYKVITHSHNNMQEPIKRFDIRLRQSVLRYIAMKRFQQIDVRRLAVSDEAGGYLYKNKEYTIVTPGIEVEKFEFDEKIRKEYREKLGIDKSVVLGYVGRLAPVKNPLFLIDILVEAKKTVPEAKLLILGDGPLKEEILKKACDVGVDDLIVMTGSVKNVYDYLQAIDVLVAPSLSEGLGMFIIEAQAAGLPCLCSKGNIPAIVDVTGHVMFEYISEGPQKWCDDISSLLRVRRNRKEMNSMVAKSRFNIENASKRLLDSIIRCN